MPDQSGTPNTDALTALPADELKLAIIIAILASLAIALIEIPRKSQTSIRACLGTQSIVYLAVLSFGNVVTTILASQAVLTMPPALAPYYFLFSAFFGVFGFEIILKNTNITMFDKGVLTIKDWTDKSLENAAAAAVEKQENLKQAEENRLISKLMKKDEKDINTRVLSKLGAGKVESLDADAKASLADAKQYKVFQLITKLSSSERAALLTDSE